MPDLMAKVEVRSLQKLDQKNTFRDVLHVTAYGFLTDLAKVLESRGYRALVGFSSSSSNNGCLIPLVVPAGNNKDEWHIVITTDKSCYDPDIGFRLHIDEPFTVLLLHLRMSIKCVKFQLTVNNGDPKSAFYRTLSVPVDSRVNMLPASPDRLPIQTLAAYYRELRASRNASLIDIANKSGDFLSIYQCEAMWISFSIPAVTERKVCIFEGVINMITGKKLDERNFKHSSAQDYTLIPSQKQLDGISVDDKIVRKFVSMPISSRCPIVKQSTGREVIDGLLIEVMPMTAEMDLINGEAVTLYHVKMQIKIPETLRVQEIEMPKFSRLKTISDVTLDTTYSDATLKDCAFWYEDCLITSNNARAQTGLTSSSLPAAKPKCTSATGVHGAQCISQAATLEDASGISFNGHGRGGYGRGDYGARLATTNSRMPQLSPAFQQPLDPNKMNPRPWVSPSVVPSNNKSSSTQILVISFPPTTHPSWSRFSNWSSPKLSLGWCVCGCPSRQRRLLRKGYRASIRTMAPHFRPAYPA